MKLTRFARFASLAAGSAALVLSSVALAAAPAAPAGAKKPVMGELPPTGSGPRMDIVFVIDSTGSMGGEIENVKSEVTSMAKEILAGKPTPDVRFGVVDYRDKGDDFRVRNIELTRDFDAVYKFINSIFAGGGGDGPESVNMGLETAVYKMAWDKDRNTAKMVFLLGDAPGHEYDGEKGYKEIALRAKKDGITVNTIACRDWAEMLTEWKDIAKITGGEFSTLKYKGVAVDTAGKSKTVVTDGSTTYVADEEISAADWSKDISTLKAEKKLRAAKAGEFGAAAGVYGGSSGAGGAAAAAPAPSMIARDKSDVGSVMTKAAKKAAMDHGVSY
jgi:hypothetical protein